MVAASQWMSSQKRATPIFYFELVAYMSFFGSILIRQDANLVPG